MKKIVIGIDISKEKIDAGAICAENIQDGLVKLDHQVFENRPAGFRRMLVWARRLMPGTTLGDILFCCETTGGYDRALCDYIYAKGLRYGVRAPCRSSAAWECARERTTRPTPS